MQSVEKVENKGDDNEADEKPYDACIHSDAPAAFLRVLNDNGLDLVGDIVKTVDHPFQMIIDFLPAHKLHGIARFGPFVEDLQTAIVDLIPTPLDLGHL